MAWPDFSEGLSIVIPTYNERDNIEQLLAEIESWPARRHLISLGATLIARIGLRVRCRDPLSGFFVFRRSFLQSVRIRGDGNKPLLEILVQARPVVSEVPYLFRNRQNGESKLNVRSIGEFLGLVVRPWQSSRDAMIRQETSGLSGLDPPQPSPNPIERTS